MGKTRKNIFHILIFLLLTASLLCSCKSSAQKKSSKRSHRYSKSKKTESKNNFKKTDDGNSAKRLSGKAAVDKVIKTARSYIGTPYQYGGSSKSGTDCSGLACKAYQSVGINLPRVAGDQAATGKKISIDDLMPGDLVFFGGKKRK